MGTDRSPARVTGRVSCIVIAVTVPTFEYVKRLIVNNNNNKYLSLITVVDQTGFIKIETYGLAFLFGIFCDNIYNCVDKFISRSCARAKNGFQ